MSKKQKRKRTREPLRYDPPFEVEEPASEPEANYKLVVAYMLDQEEMNALIQASFAPYVELPPSAIHTDYETYSEDEVITLIDGTFHPRKSKKRSKS